jgi:hypothetical protein
MLIVLSPAKSLDFTPPPVDVAATRPSFRADTAELVEVARKLSRADLRRLMSISEKLADLNYERFQAFNLRKDVGLQAVLAFAGDVYDGLDARSLDADALAWAQDHLRLLSGLYGVLRPLDRIQPYRLEMGIRLRTARGASLYDFWGDRIALALNAAAKGHADRTLVNLASAEYFGSVDARALKLPLVNVRFLEAKDGEAKIISFYAKKARGLMARYAVQHRLERSQDLKAFDTAGYRFDPAASTETDWVFVRPQP